MKRISTPPVLTKAGFGLASVPSVDCIVQGAPAFHSVEKSFIASGCRRFAEMEGFRGPDRSRLAGGNGVCYGFTGRAVLSAFELLRPVLRSLGFSHGIES